jgi:hypothetical protein
MILPPISSMTEADSQFLSIIALGPQDIMLGLGLLVCCNLGIFLCHGYADRLVRELACYPFAVAIAGKPIKLISTGE